MAKLDPSQKHLARAAVHYTEYERGWGSRPDGTDYYDDINEAQDVVKAFNARNNSPTVPDWYMIAELQVLK